MNKLKIFYSPLSISIYVFLLYQLKIYNLYSGLFDEGFLQYNSHLITQNQIPYRDFFLSVTPGSFYVLAIFYKLLGNFIIIERILGIVIAITILFVSNRLFRLQIVWQYIYLISLALLAVAPARTIFYNDTSILFTLSALFFILKGLEKDKVFLIGVAGLMSGLSFMFKQSVGGLLFLFVIIGIVLVVKKKDIFKVIRAYLIGVLAIILPVSIYFIINNAFKEAVYYVFLFAGVAKSHSSSFLMHRLLAIPIIIALFIIFRKVKIQSKILLVFLVFIVSLFYLMLDTQRIGRLMSYLPDPVFYVQSIFLLFPLVILGLPIVKKKILRKKIILISLVYLVLYLSMSASGYNMYPAAVVAPLFIPLLIYISEHYSKKITRYKLIFTLITAAVIISYTLYFSHNPFHLNDPTFGSYSESEYVTSLNIKQAQYLRFTPLESADLMNTISYIKENTGKDEKIFCFPYCPGLLFLAERNGGSYYSLFFFETFAEKDQDAVIGDLQKNNVNLIIMQKTGGLEQRILTEEQRLPKISNFISKNYKKTLETRNFVILKKIN